jgi:hypothetical protein
MLFKNFSSLQVCGEEFFLRVFRGERLKKGWFGQAVLYIYIKKAKKSKKNAR